MVDQQCAMYEISEEMRGSGQKEVRIQPEKKEQMPRTSTDNRKKEY